jgi:hypothetical protein
MEIIKDTSYGIIDSARLDIFAFSSYSNSKCLKIILKILKYNLCLHILPTFLANLLTNFFQVSFQVLFYYLNFPLMLTSIFLHTVAYIELANALGTVVSAKKFRKVKPNVTFSDSITVVIMMAIYQLVVFFSTKIISLVLGNTFYMLGLLINFIILTIYHSLYAYNNLWQVLCIDINQRITIHEKRWAYFLGYGLPATVLYALASDGYIMAIYNIYIGIILSIPLLMKFDYDFYFGQNIPYFKIDLSLFSVLIMWVFKLVKKIFNFR